ncbi:MAG: leucine-rich repeat domain-containing protein [Bacteroidales bacterium]|nr:leucine-rich repeat domain-containing protein [Bacteroidales bacterium]
MKKTFLILAALLCCCFALKAQELMPLNAYSPVGELGTIGGREAIVVDLGGSIGKVAVATKNIGATDDNPYGTEFNSEEAFDTSVTGLTDGWYVPSAAELEALMGHLQANQAFTGLEWNVTQISALQFPGYKLDDDIMEKYIGSYASSDKRQVGGNWYFSDLEFQITAAYDLDPTITIYIDPEVDQATFQCVIRPFRQLSAPILYTSANHEVVMPKASDVFGANIQSNVYDAELDQGVISFDGDVTSIGDYAFFNCTSLTSIIIPNSVTSIGNYALELCTGITSINIPSSVTSIGWCAFDYCTSLTSIAIPENVTFIDGFAFSNCSSLTSINIPDNVTSIEKYTFNNCSRLTSIAIPSTVTSIGEYAFSGCSGLTSISLPNGLLSLGDHSFNSCIGLTSFTIPSSVTSIGNGILSSCSSLQSVAVESGNTVYDSRDNCNAIIETATNTMIAGFTFSNFPTSVTTIGNYAFFNCKGLTSMTIPSTVTKLGDHAFSGCSNLASMTIPSTVTKLGDATFSGCSSLVSIIIPSTVTKLGDDAFSGCRSLASITIPSSVESIGSDAFSYCSSLTSISLPNSLLSLGNYSFSNCTGLTSITIPNGSIGNWAFHGCSGLESVILQDGVTSIGDFAFYECASLSSVDIPGSVASIGIYAFQNCRSLTSITIPNGNIGMWAFYGCSELESVMLQNGVTGIGDFAFEYCTKLPSITIPGSVESIGRAAFNGCSGLESVILQDGVKSIGEAAFYDCTKLPSVTIPSSVESIGGSAFEKCNFANIISKAQTAPTLASKIPNASNNVYIPTGALQSYQNNWGRFGYNFIEQDREVCTFNGNSSNAWSDASNWEENAVPTKNCPSVFINADCQVDADAEVGAIIVAAGMTLTVDTEKTLKPDGVTLENGVQLVNNGTVNCNAITLEDGAQLFNNGTVNSSKLTVKKDITGYGTGAGNWYLVSPPVDKDGYYWYPNMLTSPEGYDLYRFDQAGDSQGNEWLNYKARYFELENQRGYLYASKNNRTIVFSGVFAATETKTLAYDANADFPGFNLVGNPYPCNATISGTGLRSSNYYYMMNAGGTALEVVVNPILAPCTGIFAVAANSDATVTFTQANTTGIDVTRGEKSSLQDIRVELLTNGKVIDRAYLNMNGESLPKFRLQDNTSEICFYQDKEELAVASTDASRGEMPLSFKAAKNGSYTITVNTENVDAEYLHLIDNLTGADVDLLAAAASTCSASTTGSASYSFEAKTDDYASRFKLVFGVKDDAASAGSAGDFAYISNGEIIIINEGRATLQVIDVLGRIVSSEEINGNCRISTNGMTAGLYILNLNGKTQKIVVE